MKSTIQASAENHEVLAVLEKEKTMDNFFQELDEAEKERDEYRRLLIKLMSYLDSDWWTEVDMMDKTTPYEFEVPVGLLWDIDMSLKVKR